MKNSVLGLLYFILAATMHADEPKAPFTLSIVPSRSNTEAHSISTASKQPDVFYVVLTNVSDRPQPIWETWCSWGYQTVSFEIVLPDGRNLSLAKKAQTFTRNFPATFIIPAGEHQIYPIRLDTEWDHLPAFATPGDTAVTLKAVYGVAPTAESTAQSVWSGRVESAGYTLTLKHW